MTNSVKLNTNIITNSKFTKANKLILSILLIFTSYSISNAQTCKGFGDVIKTTWQTVYKIAHPIGEKALTLIPIIGQNQKARGLSNRNKSNNSTNRNRSSKKRRIFSKRN
jgi:hypothetical protein